MNKRELGNSYESSACEYLENEGIRIIVRNYRKRIGEIDIIAKDGDYLVFVEVKYRKSLEQGGAAYAIPISKQRTIIRVAQWFLAENNLGMNCLCRFDAVLIDGDHIEHIKNAWRA